MAMEIVHVIDTHHEDEVVSIAFNRMRKEIYSASQGGKDIKVWDFKTGQHIRTQRGHRGWVTCLVYATTVKMLFSGGLDGLICVWTDRGVELQTVHTGGPVFSLTWNAKRRILAVGGMSAVQIFKIDTSDVQKLNQAKRAVAVASKGPGKLSDIKGRPSDGSIIHRAFLPLRGPEHCHTDAVKSMVATDAGKLVTVWDARGRYDRCLCFYDCEKPKESFRKYRNCHAAAVTSMVVDMENSWVLTGSYDGGFRVWSMEGRCLDRFENISDSSTEVAFVTCTKNYWIKGRGQRVLAFDPRAPANISEYIQDSNQLNTHKVTLLYTPQKTDLVMAATQDRKVVVWRYNRAGAYRVFRGHADWVEALIVVNIGEKQGKERIFSCSADGTVNHWKFDVEQNCDIYTVQEEISMHTSNILCVAYSESLECIVTGAEDSTIRVHYLDGHIPMDGDEALPTCFKSHTDKVTGLVVMGCSTLISVSFDKSIRTWSLEKMKPIQVVSEAHPTAIQCIEFCGQHQEVATCGMEHRVRIWDASDPQSLRCTLILDHRIQRGILPLEGMEEEGHETPDDELLRRTSSRMKWLTRSDVPARAGGIVEEAIIHASRDIPEVTQARWIPFRGCWVTASDDDMIRLWSREGVVLHAFVYSGGSVQCLFVDAANELVLAAMLDKSVRVFALDDPVPMATYAGHEDIVRCIGYIKDMGYYVTGSWDKSIRLWLSPLQGGTQQTARLADEMDDEDEEMSRTLVSSFEKANPLHQPECLATDYGSFWKTMAMDGDGDGPPPKGKGGSPDTCATPVGSSATSLDQRLDELNKKLLKELPGSKGKVEETPPARLHAGPGRKRSSMAPRQGHRPSAVHGARAR